MSERTEVKSVTEQIAKVCHQANKAHCENNGDFSQKDWHEAQDWQRESMLKGVEFQLANPDGPVDANHNAWLKYKLDEGWIWGEVKDEVAKTHPAMVPYDELPLFQRQKDAIIRAIVTALIPIEERMPLIDAPEGTKDYGFAEKKED